MDPTLRRVYSHVWSIVQYDPCSCQNENNEKSEIIPGNGNPFEGLKLDSKGDLIDKKTGKLLNDLGATRFDIALSTLRGDMGGKYGEESTERESGQILDSLVRFPAPYTFQIVGKASEGFVEDVKICVADVIGRPVVEQDVTVKERKGGKYVSIGITAVMQSAEKVQDVYDALGKDDRVMMKF